jgi:hypothetical protein
MPRLAQLGRAIAALGNRGACANAARARAASVEQRNVVDELAARLARDAVRESPSAR